jgi:hypothetical protein
MKKLFIVLCVFMAVSFSAMSQVTKSDLVKMMNEISTTEDKFEKIYIYNTVTFYTDGTSKSTYAQYSKVNGEYANSIGFYDSGIVLLSKKNGVDDGRYIYPYASISYVEMTKTGIWIYLKD